MRSVNVIRFHPDTLKECDGLFFTNACHVCVLGTHAGNCRIRNDLYKTALDNGDITKTQNECGNGYKYVNTCKKCGKKYDETEYHKCEE
jgi:hypothetical protein